MNKKNISDIISGIDDSFIEEADLPEKHKSSKPVIITLAACFTAVLILAAVLFIIPSVTPPAPGYSQETTEKKVPESQESLVTTETRPSSSEEIGTAPAFPELATVPYWSDLNSAQKYGEVNIGNSRYSTQAHEISADDVNTFISDAIMSGYDIYEDKTYSINAKVYSVKNISEECAVAVNFQNEDKYYVYVNSYYTPDTLGDFIEALNLKETLFFGKAYKYYSTEKEHINITYEDFDDSFVWEMILDDTTVKNVQNDTFYDKLLDISVDIPLLGYKNISLSVTEDGYIITNILNTQKSFFIGEAKTRAFADFIHKNVKYTEAATVFEPPFEPEAEDFPVIEVTAPAYNPNES